MKIRFTFLFFSIFLILLEVIKFSFVFDFFMIFMGISCKKLNFWYFLSKKMQFLMFLSKNAIFDVFIKKCNFWCFYQKTHFLMFLSKNAFFDVFFKKLKKNPPIFVFLKNFWKKSSTQLPRSCVELFFQKKTYKSAEPICAFFSKNWKKRVQKLKKRRITS